MFLFSRHDPCPPSDRRWRRAGHLVETGQRPSPEHDGRWVEQATTYRSALAACLDEADCLRLAGTMPALFQAHCVSQANPPLLKWALEARLVAGEPFGEIARKCALLPEAVEAYEALFFSVVDKLDASTWIACRVLGARSFTGMTERDLDIWWKVVGYGLGPVALDSLLHAPGFPRPETPADIDEALARAAGTLFRWKRLLAAYLLPVTPETALQVLQLSGQLQMNGRETRPEPEAGPVAALLKDLLNDQGVRLPIGEQEPAVCLVTNADLVGRGEQRKAV